MTAQCISGGMFEQPRRRISSFARGRLHSAGVAALLPLFVVLECGGCGRDAIHSDVSPDYASITDLATDSRRKESGVAVTDSVHSTDSGGLKDSVPDDTMPRSDDSLVRPEAKPPSEVWDGASGDEVPATADAVFGETTAECPLAETWSSTYGTKEDDYAFASHPTSDGGYVLVGATGPGLWTPNRDALMVKVDTLGNEEWTKTFGGEQDDFAMSIVEANDGGYVFCGATASFGAGNYDVWLVKTDAAGAVVWSKTYGTAADERGRTLKRTTWNGYIIAGSSPYPSGIWLLGADLAGEQLWQSHLSLPMYGERVNDVVETQDGGYVLAGSRSPQFVDEEGTTRIALLVGTDSGGQLLWETTVESDWGDAAGLCVVESGDGGYLWAGWDMKYEGYDSWLMRTDPGGEELWTASYGEAGQDNIFSVLLLEDGGLAMAGRTAAFDAKTSDLWLLGVDSSGDQQWETTLGGEGDDGAFSVHGNLESGLALAGYSSPSESGDRDFWLVKTCPPQAE